MWLERFGTINQNVFFGFCAVVFVILVLVIFILVIKLCYSRQTPVMPGHSLTSTLVISTLFISVSVLMRGVQPHWNTVDALANVCQIFVPFITLGYILFGAALFIRMWMMVIYYWFDKIPIEWIANFILWVIVIIIGTLIIIWEATFTPNVFKSTLTSDNDSAVLYNMTTENTSDVINYYECRGWLADGSRDIEQFAWRVTMSCVMAVILLMAVAAFPFCVFLNMHPEGVPHVAKVVIISLLIVSVNTLCCVIAGLIVWFRYWPQPITDLRLNDTKKYAVIGSLQLWMLVVALAATLVSEIVAVRTGRSATNSQRAIKSRPTKAAKNSAMASHHKKDNETKDSHHSNKTASVNIENGRHQHKLTTDEDVKESKSLNTKGSHHHKDKTASVDIENSQHHHKPTSDEDIKESKSLNKEQQTWRTETSLGKTSDIDDEVNDVHIRRTSGDGTSAGDLASTAEHRRLQHRSDYDNSQQHQHQSNASVGVNDDDDDVRMLSTTTVEVRDGSSRHVENDDSQQQQQRHSDISVERLVHTDRDDYELNHAQHSVLASDSSTLNLNDDDHMTSTQF